MTHYPWPMTHDPWLMTWYPSNVWEMTQSCCKWVLFQMCRFLCACKEMYIVCVKLFMHAKRPILIYHGNAGVCVCVWERERERERLDSFLLSIESAAMELCLWRYSDVWHDPYMRHAASMCMYVCSTCICIWRCRCIYLGLCIWIYIFRAVPKILQGIWSSYLERPVSTQVLIWSYSFDSVGYGSQNQIFDALQWVKW